MNELAEKLKALVRTKAKIQEEEKARLKPIDDEIAAVKAQIAELFDLAHSPGVTAVGDGVTAHVRTDYSLKPGLEVQAREELRRLAPDLADLVTPMVVSFSKSAWAAAEKALDEAFAKGWYGRSVAQKYRAPEFKLGK